MKIEYDKDADAVYIEFSGACAKTKIIDDNLAIDYDLSGDISGIEILSASRYLKSNGLTPKVILKNLIVDPKS